MSKGEDYIVSLLRAAHVKFEREKTYPDLHGKRNVPLRFDFYLPDYQIHIEYDGIQHYQQISQFTNHKGYLAARERDRKKNSYCLARNLKLYRIPYWELSTIHNFNDLFRPQYLVKSKFHNDYLTPP